MLGPSKSADGEEGRNTSGQSSHKSEPPSGGYVSTELVDSSEQSWDSRYNQNLNFRLISDHLSHEDSTSSNPFRRSVGDGVFEQSNLLPISSGRRFPSQYPSVYEPQLAYTSNYGSQSSRPQSVDKSQNYMQHSRNPSSNPAVDHTGGHWSTFVAYPYNYTNLPDPSQTEAYLRKELEIPPDRPVNLSALPNITDRYPPISDMIKLAIWGSRDRMLTLRGIYNEIEKRYPSLRDLPDKPWQRSIRHNLSLKAMFVRLEKPPHVSGYGQYWIIDYRNGPGNKNKKGRNKNDNGNTPSMSPSTSDDELSEDTGNDPRRSGEYKGSHYPMNASNSPYGPYGRTPPMFQPATGQAPAMSGYPYMPPFAQHYPHLPPPVGMASAGPSSTFLDPRGMPLPYIRTEYDPMTGLQQSGTYMQGQTSAMPGMTGLPMPPMGASPYVQGSGTGTRRPASNEDEEKTRKVRRRTDN